MASGARQRALAAEIRDARKKSGWEAQAVAQRLGWSKATMSRVESGARAISEADLAAILAIIGVTGTERDRLLGMAHDLHQPGWWESRATAGLPAQLTAVLGFEREALRITELTLALVPGLLQTADYARAVMSGGGVPAPEADARVAVRVGRQEVITRRRAPVELTALIDEGALLRPVGTPGVMADQVHRLISIGKRTNVTIQVLPFGVHPGIDGPFLFYEFAKAPSIVHVEHHSASAFLDEPEDVSAYDALRSTVLAAALSAVESAELLATYARDWEGRGT
ncbi:MULTISPECIES: helix-turn-helix transcriptional regulator [unclassified Saccharopolyspora]|uniref:helix-turn-helix domain-containing protein n=1 Tax=unclassified Saccharopolyspora TaxID=2646250 RepID=UPI001CD5F580|nr:MULTISPECIES: helix-turn-helix transcriptional regulator [unclassified Saccharopolyspora]MCA1189366.1 helix-turn-helix domain-containing protein [Saccharopolyspora sp. 6T]MCA1283696.1 helix-turn-helix domain-containing protein [Saccharopolyspora sp. 7B]